MGGLSLLCGRRVSLARRTGVSGVGDPCPRRMGESGAGLLCGPDSLYVAHEAFVFGAFHGAAFEECAVLFGGQRVPVVARLGVRAEVLTGPRDDVVGLADVGEVLRCVAVAVLFPGVDDVNGGVVEDELGVLELGVCEPKGVPIESPAVNLGYDGLWDERLVAHG